MASIRDVAKMAGVSITTVSRALNQFDDVNEETRKKVMSAAKKLKYRPNAMARSLRKRQSNAFGYVISTLNQGAKHNILQECLCGISSFTRSIDYDIILLIVDSEKQLKKSYVQFVEEYSLEGLILQGLRSDDPYYLDILNHDTHCVLVDLPIDGINVGNITTDNHAAAKEAVEYLADCGHKNIAIMNGSKVAPVSITRLEGYMTALSSHGLPLRSEYILDGNFSEDISYQVAKEFLPKHPEVTAFFCSSDLMAYGVINAAKDLNISVPERLSVVGFDDIPISSYLTPKLTTVRQNFFKMGYYAAKMLYDIVKERDELHSRNVEYSLVKRDSVRQI